MSYQWKFADDSARERLGETPERMLENAVTVKKNNVREVLQCGSFFWKCDFRGGWHMQREWKSAALVKKQQLHCVEYLAFGQSRQGNVIVTAALPGALSALEFWYQEVVSGGKTPEIFLHSFTGFVKMMLDSGLFHPDFHLGNILYQPDENQFTLVDVDGVRRASFYDRVFQRYRMERIILECRRILTDEELAGWIARCGISQPEQFLKSALKREAEMLDAEWAKRAKQIRAEYPKFTSRENSMLFTLSPGRKRHLLENCTVLEDSPERLRKIFLAHFYLDFALLEHRNVAALDTEHLRLWVECAPRRKNKSALRRFEDLKNQSYPLADKEFRSVVQQLLGGTE